jgi:hypothetical protein
VSSSLSSSLSSPEMPRSQARLTRLPGKSPGFGSMRPDRLMIFYWVESCFRASWAEKVGRLHT